MTDARGGKHMAAGNRVHIDSKDPRIVRPKGHVILLRKAGNVFVKDATGRRPGFSPAGLSPEVCVTDEGQTIRPVRSEGGSRAQSVVILILDEWRMAKRNTNSDHMQRKSLRFHGSVGCESDGGED